MFQAHSWFAVKNFNTLAPGCGILERAGSPFAEVFLVLLLPFPTFFCLLHNGGCGDHTNIRKQLISNNNNKISHTNLIERKHFHVSLQSLSLWVLFCDKNSKTCNNFNIKKKFSNFLFVYLYSIVGCMPEKRSAAGQWCAPAKTSPRSPTTTRTSRTTCCSCPTSTRI